MERLRVHSARERRLLAEVVREDSGALVLCFATARVKVELEQLLAHGLVDYPNPGLHGGAQRNRRHTAPDSPAFLDRLKDHLHRSFKLVCLREVPSTADVVTLAFATTNPSAAASSQAASTEHRIRVGS